MTTLIEDALRFQQFVLDNGWDFYFVGGIAVQIWGEPRLTRDIDLHIFTNLQDEEGLVNQIVSIYPPKFADASQFALTERILPVLSPDGVTIDVILSGLSDLSESLTRSTYQKFTDSIALKICSAEDLVILKTVAGRDRDWGDIESVLIKQTSLDWAYIETSIQDLFEYDPELPAKFQHMLAKKQQHYRP